MELVTVVVPSFNGRDLLEKYSLKSILRQTHTNLEILIINDGVDDATRNYLDSLNDGRIKYEEIEKKKYEGNSWAVGGSRNRNYSLEIAKGNYICPIDQDDIWGPTCVEKKLSYLSKNKKIDFVYGRAVNVGWDKVIGVIGGHIAKDSFLKGHNPIPHLSVMYRSSLVKYKYPETGKIAGDYVLWKKMYQAGVSMHFLNKIDTIRNGRKNSHEFLCKIYKKHFKIDF